MNFLVNKGEDIVQIDILDFQETHKLCVITTRKGYSYASDWAIEKDKMGNITSPTKEQVKQAWREDRSSFAKYNGRHLF